MNDVSSGDNPTDDFDLFWGMGPNHANNNGSSTGNTNDDNNNNSGSTRHQQHDNLRDITSGMGVGSSAGGMSSTSHSLSTPLMGGLWSHGSNLEAYGHRHHVHAQADGLSDAGGGLASPQRSHRPAWMPAPSPGIGGARSASTMQVQRHHQPAVGNAINPGPATGVPAASDARGSIVDSKLDELAAAISSSVLGKLDLGVKGALLVQHGASSSPPSVLTVPQEDESFQRRMAEAVAPLRSRVVALEEQMADFKAAIERNTAAMAAASAASRHPPSPRPGEGFIQQPYQHHQQQPQGKNPLLPEYMAGENETTLPSLRGQHAGRGGRGGTAAAGGGVAALEQSLASLAQRTGTLEGRHKQVQAKVALLDNAFGSKASDWAQTVKYILAEREASAGGGGKACVRAGTKGGKKTAAGVVAPQQPVPSGSGSNNIRGGGGGGGGGRGGFGAIHHPRESGPGGLTETSLTGSGAGGGNESGHVVAGGASTTHTSGQATSTSVPKPFPQGADASCTTPEVVQASHASQGCATLVSGRCSACMETEERCTGLEARVLESERALALFQSKVKAATVAAAAAEIDATKALKTAVVAAKTESKREADTVDGRQRGFGGNWASKASVEKLASDLKQLSEKTKDGEDALALVDHGLRGVRDEVCTEALVLYWYNRQK